MNVGLCTIVFRELLLKEVIQIARSIGVDGIEVLGQAPHVGVEASEKDVENISNEIFANGLRVSVYGSYIRFAYKGKEVDPQGAFRKALMIAKLLGTSIMRIWVGDKPSKDMNEGDWSLASAALSRACEAAAEFGITLAMEMHDGYFTDTAASTLRLIQEVNAPNLKANYQPSFRPDHDDIMEGFRAVKGFIANVHAQNFYGFAKTSGEPIERSLLSNGVVDYVDIVRELQEIGYPGFISMEFAKEPDKLGNIRKDAAYLLGMVHGKS